VIESFEVMDGGELYVPRIPSMRVTDLAEAIAPGAELIEIGMRPGEKLHEEMISPDDARRTVRLSDRFVVCPTLSEWTFRMPSGEPVADGFSYTSENNDEWLSIQMLQEMIRHN
jgi:UDP-N-acetylglucosamine 4,6-dehydratase